jgi:hypothetical protein
MHRITKIFYSLGFFLLAAGVLPAQNILKPFPQHVAYSEGVIKPNHIAQTQLDDNVRSFYLQWKEQYIGNDAGDGQLYINAEGSAGKKKCVSEGQGYRSAKNLQRAVSVL